LINCQFSSEINSAFAKTLQLRVNSYFKDNNISKGANTEMVLKTISALSIYLLPFVALFVFQISSLPLLFLLWAIMGFGKAFIGMSVMHDSLHGSFSNKQSTNRLVALCTWLLGVDPRNWKIQHNVLHHSFTNIEHADEDIEPRFIFRFSPHQPRLSIQKYQHLYAFFFYGLGTLIWVTVKDFVKAIKYKNEGFIKSGRDFNLHITQIIIRKVVYFSLFLVLPSIWLAYPFWMVALMFLTMHFVAGNILTFTFQCAHVMDTSEFVNSPDGQISENRLAHQLKTTANFGVKSNLLFWFTGGLNHQIEHHLFPHICHIHYRKISGIVASTASEYNLPYHTQPTLATAVYQHLYMLKELGSEPAKTKKSYA